MKTHLIWSSFVPTRLEGNSGTCFSSKRTIECACKIYVPASCELELIHRKSCDVQSQSIVIVVHIIISISQSLRSVQVGNLPRLVFRSIQTKKPKVLKSFTCSAVVASMVRLSSRTRMKRGNRKEIPFPLATLLQQKTDTMKPYFSAKAQLQLGKFHTNPIAEVYFGEIERSAPRISQTCFASNHTSGWEPSQTL
jgi:hypothetical protein